jgi:hypothetical protein
VFIPSDVVRQAASAVAAREGLAEDWLNDAVKGFLPGPDPDAQKCGSSSPRSWTRCRTDRGPAKLVVEQRARAVLAISDHTYVLAGGEVRMSGSPAELSASPAFVESFRGGTVARLAGGAAAISSFVVYDVMYEEDEHLPRRRPGRCTGPGR